MVHPEEITEQTLEIDNLPNRLTIFRLILVPVVVGLLLMINPEYKNITGMSNSTLGWLAGWLFVLASITDFFDGYLARKMNLNTLFGSFLDPVADKFLVVSSLIMLLELKRVHVIIVVILICRELYITSLRLLAKTQNVEVPVGQMGKWKTAVQMVGVPQLMAFEVWWIFDFPLIGTVCLYIASFLSVASAFRYSLKLIQQLRLQRKEKRKLKKEGQV